MKKIFCEAICKKNAIETTMVKILCSLLGEFITNDTTLEKVEGRIH